nr:HisA/HisF-related TIM barrel protein [Cylindrospermopsis raciborskii]
MLKHRIIPALLLQNAGLVKTFKFKNPKYVGDPINAIRIFNDKEVDELMVLDILASKEGREPNYNIIERIAGECFMPLCYGVVFVLLSKPEEFSH